MKTQGTSYVERLVSRTKETIEKQLTESIDYSKRLEAVRAAAESSAQRQNHTLQGEIYKAEDLVKKAVELLENAKSSETLKFEQIKGMSQQLAVAEADLKCLQELQVELFPKTEPNV